MGGGDRQQATLIRLVCPEDDVFRNHRRWRVRQFLYRVLSE
jgi:hypothetical protein